MESSKTAEFFAAGWQRISDALAYAQQLRGDESCWPPNHPTVKRCLEQIAVDLSLKDRQIPSKAQKRSYHKFAKSAHLLLTETETLPGLASSEQLKSELKFLCQRADQFAKLTRGHASNVDVARNLAWARAATVYHEVTQGSVNASERPDGGEPGGPFVRFIQAFMAAVPGEIEPTGNQIRAWVRTYWRKWEPRQQGHS